MAQSLTLNHQEFSSVNLRGTRLCAKMEVNLSHVYLKSKLLLSLAVQSFRDFLQLFGRLLELAVIL